MAGFIDTRLHISVRPRLEYLIPEVGLAVRRCLLGDITMNEALSKLELCTFEDVSPPEEEDDVSLQSLRSHMSATVSLIHDYLCDIVSQWKEHLTITQSHVTRIVHTYSEERLSALRARKQYRPRNPHMVDEEFAREIERIRSSLNESLDRVRETKEPNPQRPSPLVESCEALRVMAAESYGTIPTKKIMHLKRNFEVEIVELQRETAKDFVLFCTRVLQK